MSKIETKAVRTKIDENFCAHKKPLSSSDWGSHTTHDKNRGRVIAFARLIDTSFQKIFKNSCAQPYSRWLHLEHQIKTTKYFLSAINRFDFYLRIVSQGLDLLTSHIHAHPIYQRFSTYQYKYCGSKSITIFRRTN